MELLEVIEPRNAAAAVADIAIRRKHVAGAGRVVQGHKATATHVDGVAVAAFADLIAVAG